MDEFIALLGGSYLLGLSVAAPIGPINVEIIRRGLTQGWRSAFFLGCGAVSADGFYFTLAMVGARAAASVVESRAITGAGLAVGGAMLCWVGIGSIRKIRSIQSPMAASVAVGAVPSAGGPGVGSIVGTYLLGLGLTLANPMTIALWLSVAAGFAASGEAEVGGAAFYRLGGVIAGALSWVTFITALTAWARRWISPALMRGVNLVSGLILITYGLLFVARILRP